MIRFAASLLLTAFSAYGIYGQTLQKGQIQGPKDISVIDSLHVTLAGKQRESTDVSWRATDQTVNFTLSAIRSKPTKGTLVVWVLGAPEQAPHAVGKSGTQKEKVGRIAFLKDLGELKGTNTFSVNFSQFAPQGNPGFITFTVNTGDVAANISKAMAEQIRKDTLGFIGRVGTVAYRVQVTTADGAASTVATVNFGEMCLDPQLRPKLEYQINPGSAEFPDQVWGNQGTVSSAKNMLNFRWQPPQGTTSAIYQIGNFTDVSPWPFWNTAKVVASGPVKISGSGIQQFSVDVSGLMKNADQSKYWFRVVPMASPTVLASQPTNDIMLTVSKPPVEAPKPTLSIKTELIGWSPGYEGAVDDKYRFVVADPKFATSQELEKIIGGPAVKGAKVYLPPSPPPKEKAWYQKVFDAIDSVLSKIKYYFDVFVSEIASMAALLPSLPFEISKSWGVPDNIADKAYKYATAPMHIADAPLNAAGRIGSAPGYVADRMMDDMGVTDPKKRAALHGNIVGSLEMWSKENQYMHSSPERLGLAPDPDFEKRTAVAYVRVTAKATGPLPAGFRMKGPSISMEVGNIAQNAELLGIKPEYYAIYVGGASAPSMADGDSVVVPVVLGYHWTKQQRPDDWNFGWTRAIKTRYSVNGNTFYGESMHKKWGTTK